jgi:hypothetical protein
MSRTSIYSTGNGNGYHTSRFREKTQSPTYSYDGPLETRRMDEDRLQRNASLYQHQHQQQQHQLRSDSASIKSRLRKNPKPVVSRDVKDPLRHFEVLDALDPSSSIQIRIVPFAEKTFIHINDGTIIDLLRFSTVNKVDPIRLRGSGGEDNGSCYGSVSEAGTCDGIEIIFDDGSKQQIDGCNTNLFATVMSELSPYISERLSIYQGKINNVVDDYFSDDGDRSKEDSTDITLFDDEEVPSCLHPRPFSGINGGNGNNSPHLHHHPLQLQQQQQQQQQQQAVRRTPSQRRIMQTVPVQHQTHPVHTVTVQHVPHVPPMQTFPQSALRYPGGSERKVERGDHHHHHHQPRPIVQHQPMPQEDALKKKKKTPWWKMRK